MEVISASELKAKCLAILDEVARTGKTVTILKRGRPVAQLLPCGSRENGYPQVGLSGTVEILGDVIEPAVPNEQWDAERRDD